MHSMSRRQFLASTAAIGALGAVPSLLIPTRPARAAAITTIQVDTRVIEVKGRAATVFSLTQPNGTHGLVAEAGQRFRVRLENRLDEETLIHWHGLTPSWQQDGVPLLSQPPLAPGAAYDYDFPLDRPGTNWMHSHHGLQEQRLMAAPLIVRDPAEAGEDTQDIVVLFHDFTFRDPDEILTGLKGGGDSTAGHWATQHSPGLLQRMMETVMPMGGMDHGTGHGGMDHGTMGAGMAHLHDVDYDAFLANDRTLDDPEVFRVERGGRVRLRLINGATATNFWLDLGRLEGRLVAVDGMPVAPVTGRRFEFAIAQRLDILLDLPAGEGAWPVFAVREGERARTGFVLATSRGTVERTAGEAAEAVQPVGLALERKLIATQPLALREADRRHTVTITEAPGYVWLLNGAAHGDHTALDVRAGERVEITFNDQTTMAHPMHLHGHHFQVVAINGERIAGAVRDTVLVPTRGSVTIAFDADNPGKWALHCHHLYHMAGGMMTTLEYQS
ncbi:MAG: multicopper oxidase family protein [Allosphingosinicella sp.]|uniref:multicopper oxidase family protein n=1 Tax=Allosphingosinicella sp. TaxID=2823234 RepID=UPI0039504298